MDNKKDLIIVGLIDNLTIYAEKQHLSSSKKVLLLKDKKNGSLYFPSASRLGHTHDEESLLGVHVNQDALPLLKVGFTSPVKRDQHAFLPAAQGQHTLFLPKLHLCPKIKIKFQNF